jgi:hypothetical protein
MVEKLLQAGVDVNVHNPKRESPILTALRAAAAGKYLQMWRRSNAHVNIGHRSRWDPIKPPPTPDHLDRTTLKAAVDGGHLQVARSAVLWRTSNYV